MSEKPTYEELLERVKGLEESQKIYQSLVENSPDLFYQTDLQGRIAYISPSVYRLSGYTAEEAIGMKMAEDVYLIPDERNVFLSKLQSAGRVTDFQARLKRKDGSFWWASTNAHYIKDGSGSIIGVEGVTRDISELKEAEIALRESERKYRHLFETAMVGIYRTRIETGEFLAANKTMARMVGYESVDRFMEEYFTSEHYTDPLRREELLKQLQINGQVDSFEVGLTKADGSTVQVAISATIYPELGYLEGVVVDLTESKMAMEALRESEDRFRALSEESPFGVSLINENNLYKYINPAFINMFGYTLEDIKTGRDWFNLAFPDKEYRKKVIKFWKDDQEVYPIGQSRPRTFDVCCKDGSIKTIMFRPVTIASYGQFVLYEDITEARRAEEEKEKLQAQLRQAQKMEAVGTLAGGVAHDFNNILQAITGYTQILLWKLERNHPEYKNLEAIQKASLRAKDLVHQLLLFSRKAETERKPVQLNREVKRAQGLLKSTIPKMVEIEIHPGKSLWTINADPVQVEQILLNLGGNAADAMPEGGRLIIETGNVTLDDSYITAHPKTTPGRYVLLTVSDTGHGIDKATVDKIFEPFFTTKEIGKGTGLGLASVYGIVKSHSGHINCYSEIGLGTTFKIYFPAIEQEEAGQGAAAVPEPPPRGTETILLVDDEEWILDLASQILKNFGYKVVTASNGEGALEIFTKRRDEIDLIILDLGMPGMGGHRCLQEIIQFDPFAKVLIASGYTMNGHAKKTLEAGAAGFIGKPYKIDEILENVRKVLDQ